MYNIIQHTYNIIIIHILIIYILYLTHMFYVYIDNVIRINYVRRRIEKNIYFVDYNLLYT